MPEISDCATRNICARLSLHSFVLNGSIKSNCNLDFHLFGGSGVIVVTGVVVNNAVVAVVAVVVLVTDVLLLLFLLVLECCCYSVGVVVPVTVL